ASTLRIMPNKVVGDCWIYDAAVLPLSIDQDEVSYSYIPQEWLGVERGALKSRTYFLVFESGDDLPDGPIKLRKDDVEDYFSDKHGYHIVVRSPNSLSSAEARQALVKSIEDILRSRSQDLLSRAQPPVGCA